MPEGKEWLPKGVKGMKVWTLLIESETGKFIEVFRTQADALKYAAEQALGAREDMEEADAGRFTALFEGGKYAEAMEFYDGLDYAATREMPYFIVEEKRIM